MRRLVFAFLVVLGLGGAAPAWASCAYGAGPQMVSLPGRPFGVQPSADGCWLFVSLLDDQAHGAGVAVLRNRDGGFRLDHVARVAASARGLALSPDGRLLATAADDRVLIFDVGKLEAGDGQPQVADLPEGTGDGAIEAVFSRDGRLLFVSEERAARLSVIDVARAIGGQGAAAIVSRVPQGRAPVGLALSPDGTKLYATSEIAPPAGKFVVRCPPQAGGRGPDQPVGMLSVIDVAKAATDGKAAVLAVAAAGCGPVRVALSADGATAWVTARGDNRLLAFTTAELHGIAADPKVASYRVGTAPVGVAVRPDGAEVWVSNSDRFERGGEGSLSALALPGGQVRSVASGQFPRDMVFLPDGKTLAVAVFASHELQIVPTGP
jgi:DNA-binding beta-propeller fold protein YncE